MKQWKKLPNTFTYLFAYFLLSDVLSIALLLQYGNADMFGGCHKGLNTTMTLIQICQNIRFDFAFVDYAYLGLVRGGASAAGQVMYWYIQRHWKLDSKNMARLLAVICFC